MFQESVAKLIFCKKALLIKSRTLFLSQNDFYQFFYFGTKTPGNQVPDNKCQNKTDNKLANFNKQRHYQRSSVYFEYWYLGRNKLHTGSVKKPSQQKKQYNSGQGYPPAYVFVRALKSQQNSC